MQILLSAISTILLCALSAIANNDDPGDSVWYFPFRVTLANGQGNSNPSRPTSFVNSTWLDINLAEPFSITAWLRVSDRKFWRAVISIESPDANSALFRIALPPDQMMFNVAWMGSPQARGGTINTTAIAPGPDIDFHFALVKDDNDITIYVDGVRRAFHTFNSQIFNPENKQIVLGRTKLDGNSLRSQWNGIIRDVYIYDKALTRAQVLQERQDTLREQ